MQGLIVPPLYAFIVLAGARERTHTYKMSQSYTFRVPRTTQLPQSHNKQTLPYLNTVSQLRSENSNKKKMSLFFSPVDDF